MAASSADTADLVKYIVSSLVDTPDAVVVTTKESEDSVLFEIALDPSDVGKVIGRQGRIIKAIRALARAAGSTADRQVEVEVAG